MKDGENRDEKPGNDSDVSPNAAARVENPGDGQPAGQDADQQERTPDHPFRLRNVPAFDRVTRMIALLGLAATIGTLGVNYWELQAIQGQLAAAVEANKQYTRQADTAEKSLDFAKISSAATDRPWMLISPSPLSLPMSAQDIKYTFFSTNFGHSPALGVTATTRAIISVDTEPGDVSKCPDCTEYVIPVGQTMQSHIKISKEEISDSTLNDLRVGSKKLYLLGRVDYRDTNQAEHHSTLCAFFDPKDDQFYGCKRKGSIVAE